MKFAVFGDIHGNIRALKAAYEAAMQKDLDKIYHLGDLGGYSPFVNEVVDFLVEHGIEGVQGNYDEAIANDREHCGCKAEDPVQEAMAGLSFAWTKEHATGKTKDYLGSLPVEIIVTANGRKVALFHATPTRTISIGTRIDRISFSMRWPERSMPTFLFTDTPISLTERTSAGKSSLMQEAWANRKTATRRPV
jgi:predicted phosphodiesterase